MTTTITYHVGDVRDVMATMPDGSAALVCTSPPFLALRSYLPGGHPDKHREIGSEATPAAFLDTMLGLTADWRRIVAPWGSIAVEIGDTYSGSGGAGGDYNTNGLREGQGKFDGSGRRNRPADVAAGILAPTKRPGPGKRDEIPGWPMAKSLSGIPTLYTWSLAYGRNLLTGAESPAGMWRIRNLLTWTRPNPPVGALGDKFRPATSYVTVACTGAKRWFDLDAVRTEAIDQRHRTTNGPKEADPQYVQTANFTTRVPSNIAGAPPLDWWDANDLDDDLLVEHWQPLHRLPTSPYKGSHYATFPEALPRRLIEAMCPREVCTVCGEPRRRIAVTTNSVGHAVGRTAWTRDSATAALMHTGPITMDANHSSVPDRADRQTIGWTDCGHDSYAPGIVLDPFGGSGTTAVAAARAGRDAILVDLDARNRDLARHRIAESLRIVDETTTGNTTVWTVEAPLPNQRAQAEGQRSIFDELEASA